MKVNKKLFLFKKHNLEVHKKIKFYKKEIRLQNKINSKKKKPLIIIDYGKFFIRLDSKTIRKENRLYLRKNRTKNNRYYPDNFWANILISKKV